LIGNFFYPFLPLRRIWGYTTEGKRAFLVLGKENLGGEERVVLWGN